MPGLPLTPPKQQRGRETVEKLLSTSLDVFAKRGLEGFTMTAVIEESGVSVGSLYHHFGSFDGLASMLFLRCSEALTNALIDAVRPARTAREAVVALVEGHLRWCIEHRAEALIVCASPYAGYLRAHTVELLAAQEAKVKELLGFFTPHIEAGRIQSLSPAVLEMLVLGPLSVAVTWWLSDIPGFDIDEAVQMLPDRIWESVRGLNS